MNIKFSINKVRTILLIYINNENNIYLSTSLIKINHILPKDIIKKFESENIITFDNSLVQGSQYQPSHQPTFKSQHKKSNEISISNCNQSIIYFTKCYQDLGKSFIEDRKIDLGSRKLGFKHSLTIQVIDNVSFKERIKSTRSVQRYNTHNDKFKLAFLSKKELKEKIIQENIRLLTNIVKNLRIIPVEETDGYQMTMTDMNGLSPFQCNLPLINVQANSNSNNCLKEEIANISNDCMEWITPFKQYDQSGHGTNKQHSQFMNANVNNENNNNLNTMIFQTETEACYSMMTVTPKQCDKSKNGNVSSFCYESESAV